MKKIIIAVLAVFLMLGLAGCTVDSEYNDRKDKQSTNTLSHSLEKENLEKKLERENKPTAIRYVYLMNYGKIVGYYIIQGKVSSSGSQIAPEDEIICRFSSDSCQAVDSAQDDGTYGQGDPGVFFFTADGTMVETSLDYVISDQPLKIDVPRLGGTAG